MGRSEVVLRRLLALHVSVRRWAGRHRIPIIAMAMGAFAVLFIYSAAHLDINFGEIRWGWLGWAATLVPFAMLANASELALCARATGRAMSMITALNYSAGATIANILPLPAGMVLRAKALVSEGAGWIESSAILTAAGLLWLAMATVCVGLALTPERSGTIALAIGVLSCLSIGGWIAWRSDLVTGMGFLLVRGVMIALLIARLYFCFLAIGHPVLLQDSVIFVLAGVVGNGVAVVPSGLGLAEAVGAAMGSFVGTLPAAAFLALGTNRLLGLAGSAIVVGAYLLRGCYRGQPRVVGAVERS